MVTTDTILEKLKEWVENKQPIPPDLWLDACSKLNVLKGDETKKLFNMQQAISIIKFARIEAGDSVAKSKVFIECLDSYKEMKIQEAKLDQIDEQIRISKLQARLGSQEMKGY